MFVCVWTVTFELDELLTGIFVMLVHLHALCRLYLTIDRQDAGEKCEVTGAKCCRSVDASVA